MDRTVIPPTETARLTALASTFPCMHGVDGATPFDPDKLAALHQRIDITPAVRAGCAFLLGPALGIDGGVRAESGRPMLVLGDGVTVAEPVIAAASAWSITEALQAWSGADLDAFFSWAADYHAAMGRGRA